MSRPFKIIIVLAAVIGCVWLEYLIDDGLGMSWPSNVVRNWQQFGLFNLHGQLVQNPGGFEATTNPDIYKGMSPVCLYPAYFITQFFAWTGLGTMSFHLLLALAVFWAIWQLLGRNSFALTVAAVAILCPGFGRWQKILDPNVIPVLLGLPYLAIVISILKRPQLGWAGGAGLFLLTLVFMALNWTTAWFLAPGALLLLGLPQINRRAVILFIGLTGLGSLLFAIGLIIVKMGSGHAGHGNLLLFLQGYTWGNVSYGAGLTTGKAFVRLAFVNGVGLLPLLLLGGWVAATGFRHGNRKNWFALSPLAVTVTEVAFMRNYFGHHPWMAAPVLLVGLVFSVALLRIQNETGVAVSDGKTRIFLLPSIVLLCFFYGLAVIEFYRANAENGRVLAHLIRHHTERSECIVIVKSIDPQTADIAARFNDSLDRRVLVADDLAHLPIQKHCVILSAVPFKDGLPLRAQASVGETHSQSFLQKACTWFNHAIARRQPGDRMDFSETYYLYETKS